MADSEEATEATTFVRESNSHFSELLESAELLENFVDKPDEVEDLFGERGEAALHKRVKTDNPEKAYLNISQGVRMAIKKRLPLVSEKPRRTASRVDCFII